MIARALNFFDGSNLATKATATATDKADNTVSTTATRATIEASCCLDEASLRRVSRLGGDGRYDTFASGRRTPYLFRGFRPNGLGRGVPRKAVWRCVSRLASFGAPGGGSIRREGWWAILDSNQ